MARPPKPVTRLNLLESLVSEVLRLEAPADTVISQFFKRHPEMGSRDRGFFAEAAWTVLRHRSWFQFLSTAGSGSLHRRLAILALVDQGRLTSVDRELSAQERDWLAHADQVRLTQVDPAVRESLPSWLLEDWSHRLGPEEALRLARTLNQPAPLDLRVNTLLAKPDQALAALAQDGIDGQLHPVIPEAIRLSGKPALQRAKAFIAGWVEVQDLGSQLLAKLLHPKRGQFIVDFCAGAGGKTLAIGAALKNTGRLYALDISAARLSKLKPRLARSGLSNVWPSAISGFSDDRVKRLSGKADSVLVDAPCSGVGTLRRNPDLKWKTSLVQVAALHKEQMAILHAASKLVKPAGRLVYATCSLLQQENENVIAEFLAAHPDFQRVSAQDVLYPQKLALPAEWQAFTEAGDLLLWPHRTDTDGFFACVLQRGRDSGVGVG